MNEDVQAEMRADAKFSARPIALTIAGFDPSCGAGITADLKVFAAHNIYGIACITALTVQSSMGVKRVEPVAPQTVRETLDDLLEDVLPNGVKVGMLATADAVSKTAQFLAKSGIGRQRIVLDPVIRSSSGRELLSPEGVAALRSELLPLVGWVTPNIEELAVLAGSPASVREDVPDAAARLQFLTSEGGNRDLHIVATGGHLDSVDDFLLTPNGKGQWVKGERVETQSTHGTGCAFSSALLCQLIAGRSPEKAAMEAKAYVSAALKAAYPVGRGTGSMHHLFRLT